MTLFDGKPLDINKTSKVVLSASRMTDMPKFYPKQIIEEVNKKLQQSKNIHTLVLWTKHPKSLLTEPLFNFLIQLKENGIQLFIHITITGLGGLTVGVKSNEKPLVLEPKAPPLQESLSVLPDVIKLVGHPERIRLRVDPIVRIADSKGNIFSSTKFLPRIIKVASQCNIKHFSFSFLENNMHRKVDRRFKQIGCNIIPPTEEEREKFRDWSCQLEHKYNVNIYSCCVPGFKETKCIDGELLQQLHDKKEPVSLNQPRKRELCGCTLSLEIGGWPPKKCFTGCDYCYANAFYID